MSKDRVYLKCPFHEKDECKSLGGRWDGDERKWYITVDMNVEPFARWMNDGDDGRDSENEESASGGGEKIYLNCPFDDKDECKKLGARWDSDARKWYVPAGKDTAPFAKWI